MEENLKILKGECTVFKLVQMHSIRIQIDFENLYNRIQITLLIAMLYAAIRIHIYALCI